MEHFSKKNANTATYATAENVSDEVGIDTTTSSSGSSGDYVWRSIPQKPGSFYIGNFSAVKHKVAHAVESPECIGLHITVTLHTSIFDMGRNGTAHEPAEYWYNHELGKIVNIAVARFVSERRPIMPSFENAIKLFSAM